ncbi:hypothetical protein [Rhodopirellula sallentina]|uniref:Signal peptide protein n=1 Tax=Rhodopirellula sallentina SM41 TaxID=1263870 RepID=M5UAP4_9BACT|nr:hypothetical protein [Rhodopirellula sallentina]EMI58495.1 signal peptide protein [Rhodopirellula sallentina SM41]
MCRTKHCRSIPGALAAILLASVTLSAADLEMVDGYGNITGVVDVARDGLTVIENTGDRFFYRRARDYDLLGGRYLGFYNQGLNRIIRFPRSGRGPVERADLNTPYPQFVPASVSVRPIGSGPGFAPYIDVWLAPRPVVPAYPGITPYGVPPVVSGYYSSGTTLSVGPIGPAIGLGPSPLISRFPNAQLQSTVSESRIVEVGRLKPVEIEFVNTHNETLIVTLTDVRHPGREPEYRLEPGGSQRVRLPRDAGQVRIDLYESFDPLGNPVQREHRVALAPEPRYEVIVHRLRIQSIAIDRTGKSPNEIEDINVQGVGVGRFILPPGDQLVSGTIDVYAVATGAANPGSVAPIVPNP